EDADRSDNAPLLTIIPPGQAEQKVKLEAAVAEADKRLNRADPELEEAQRLWEAEVKRDKLPPKVKTILAVESDQRKPAQQAELPRPGPLADRPGQPADRPRHRQPLLGAALRRRPDRDAGGLRHPRQAADPRRTARLAGDRVRRPEMGRQKAVDADGDFGRLP